MNYDHITYHRTVKVISRSMLLAAIAVPLLLSACSDSPTDSNENSGDNIVEMGAHTFSPSVIIVAEGATVTWVNESGEVHTVTSGTQGQHDGQFDSGSIPPGGEYSYTFESTGTYQYFCIPHLSAGMTGTVSVVAGSQNGGSDDDDDNDDNDNDDDDNDYDY